MLVYNMWTMLIPKFNMKSKKYRNLFSIEMLLADQSSCFQTLYSVFTGNSLVAKKHSGHSLASLLKSLFVQECGKQTGHFTPSMIMTNQG